MSNEVDENYIDEWPTADEAIEIISAYECARQLRPDDASTHFDYGLAFMELGPGFEKHAIEAFKLATGLRPSWAEAFTQLGYAYVSANQREEAIEAYRQSLELSPNDLETLGALAHAAFLGGHYGEAEQAGFLMADITPLTSGSHLILGLAQLLLGKYTESAESFRRAIQLEPDLSEAHYGLGLASVALGHASTVQIEHQMLDRLNPELAGRLAEHSKHPLLLPAEIVHELFGVKDEERAA